MKIDAETVTLELILCLQSQPAARDLQSRQGTYPIVGDLYGLLSQITRNPPDLKHVGPLLKVVIGGAKDEAIWSAVFDFIAQSGPTQLPVTTPPASSTFEAKFPQTPFSFNTSTFENSSEYRKHVDPILKEELHGNMELDHPDFIPAFFEGVPQLGTMTASVFRMCQERDPPLYKEESGWVDLVDFKEEAVLDWFRTVVDHFLCFAKSAGFQPSDRRTLSLTPTKPLEGSVAQRTLDIGIVRSRLELGPTDGKGVPKPAWDRVLFPGELKSNPSRANSTITCLDLARRVREMFGAQDGRRFVLGFTLCGSIMRLYEFDRTGATASEDFDIHKKGETFVKVILGYLWMNPYQAGFDPTISEDDGKLYMEITRDGKKERLVITERFPIQASIASRGTACWKVYRDGDESCEQLVVKDSWQFPERPVEGEILKMAAEKGVEHVAKYYHHETVQLGDEIDDIKQIRRGLKSKGIRYSFRSPRARGTGTASGSSSLEQTRSNLGKRPSDTTEPSLSANKRQRSVHSQNNDDGPRYKNREHRRLITETVGKRITNSSSVAVMLQALEHNIKGM